MIRAFPALIRWTKVVNASITTQQASNVSAVDLKQVPCDAAIESKNDGNKSQTVQQKHHLVQAAFANLTRSPTVKENLINRPVPNRFNAETEKQILEATDLNTLLEIAGKPLLNRKNALGIISILGDWSADKKIELADFETDKRFIKMCKFLGQSQPSSDPNSIAMFANEDEAAKMLSNVSLNQMVKIISKLAVTKKRSVVLLQSLSFNISKSEEKMTVKQCADVLFAMASLRFHDEVLLVKTCSDAIVTAPTASRSAVVGSIARSLGILRYRDCVLLDCLGDWVIKNIHLCRPHDVAALIMTLALVDYQPGHADLLFEVALPHIRPLELPSSSDYLDAVWSLVLLGRSTHQHIAHVLSVDFIDKLKKEGDKLSHSTCFKLLNINGAVGKIIKEYKGPTLNQKQVGISVPLFRSKEKSALVTSVMDTLANLLPSETYLKKDIDTGAGFLLDGECLVDPKCNPLPISSNAADGIKVAIVILDYNETCLGTRSQPNGLSAFSQRLLRATGYRVLQILHSEFNPKSKLVSRVQYLEQRLKGVVTS